MDNEFIGDFQIKIKEAAVLSWEDCNYRCAENEFKIMGMRYNAMNQMQECWCADEYGTFGALVLTSCNYYCSASPLYRCGTSLEKYLHLKVLSVYSVIEPDDADSPQKVTLSQNHIFEGFWNDGAADRTVCQWENTFIMHDHTTTNGQSGQLDQIAVIEIPDIHGCDEMTGGFSRTNWDAWDPNDIKLKWNKNDPNSDWTRSNKIRYILPPIYPFTMLPIQIISAAVMTSEEISER